MTPPFGHGELAVLRRLGAVPGEDDLSGVLAAAAEHRSGGPVLLLSRCAPTAAFSRRDTLLPGYDRARSAAERRGFAPVIRPVGGHLAGYDEGSLVVHLWAPHPEPRRDLRARFQIVGDALVAALTQLGVTDPGVGPVPGEYCDGAWSVNVAGRTKVAGTGQRLFRGGYLFSAVLTVTRDEALPAMLVDAYDRLGLPLDPATVGAVSDFVPEVSVERAREVVAAALWTAVADGRRADVDKTTLTA